MPVLNRRKARITLFAWQEGDEFFMSPYEEALHGRRPIERFDSREELEAAVRAKGNAVEWL